MVTDGTLPPFTCVSGNGDFGSKLTPHSQATERRLGIGVAFLSEIRVIGINIVRAFVHNVRQVSARVCKVDVNKPIARARLD